MPYFRYRATDPTGTERTGTIQAADSVAAIDALRSQRLQVRELLQGRHPVQVDRLGAPSNAPIPSRPTATRPQTGKVCNKQLFFLLSQLATLFRSGVTPKLALEQLSSQSPNAAYRAALKDAAESVSTGHSLADVFARYPRLFPADVVGSVRAGELGGFLPDALAEAAESSKTIRQLNLQLGCLGLSVLATLSFLPMVFFVVQASLRTMDRQIEEGFSLPTSTVVSELGNSLIFAGPFTPLILLIPLALWRLWLLAPFRRLRHWLGLKLPFLGRRARAEGMTRFATAAMGLAKAGIPPHTAFRVAASTVPNDVLRTKLLASADTMRESDPMSFGLARAGMFGHESVAIVQNGELIGDVPGALTQIAVAQKADFGTAQATLARKIALVILPILGGGVLVTLAYAYRTLYGGLIERLLQ